MIEFKPMPVLQEEQIVSDRPIGICLIGAGRAGMIHAMKEGPGKYERIRQKKSIMAVNDRKFRSFLLIYIFV